MHSVSLSYPLCFLIGVSSLGSVACAEPSDQTDDLRGNSLRVSSMKYPASSKWKTSTVAPSVPVGSFIQGADPFVMRSPDGAAYLYTTNRPGINVPVYKAESPPDWVSLGDAMPSLPPWANSGRTWAPETIRLKSGKYLLFFTAKDRKTGKQCVGRAEAMSPAGPFADSARRPFICDAETLTSIDPSPFEDSDGGLYLLWKTKEIKEDGEYLTKIWIRSLTPDGLLAGDDSVVLLVNDLSWEGKHVEAPTLVKNQGKYYLFYSAGASSSMGYSVNYAVSDSVYGAYQKSLSGPIIRKNGFLKGPGHQSLLNLGPGSYKVFYHSVYPKRKKQKEGRARYIDQSYLCFQDGKPVAQNTECPL